ncbi:epithelial-stromal interaction protein 1 isoform X2 [Corythoichthys intestinalis]|uniref:epithelial-stromal interaction protein 1 isoform X2 n=1 Tax=Corythoichthys intestinalis TaxID=161448 RepID=UPI0025A65F95|nr:epithelial-stromal interaction protein 1 isoform X2 [Corythoichthys intestinalis]
MKPNRNGGQPSTGVPSKSNNTTRDAFDNNNMESRMRSIGGVTLISPNESNRNKIKMTAQKEEEELQKWREAHKITHVHTTPERLGGDATLDEVRARQFKDLRCSKMEKKLKQDDLHDKKRQEEEDELMLKKHKQRQKAEGLEAKEKKRQEQLQEDYAQVNSAFLDKLNLRSKESEAKTLSEAGVRNWPSSACGQETPGPHPEESSSGQAEETVHPCESSLLCGQLLDRQEKHKD